MLFAAVLTSAIVLVIVGSLHLFWPRLQSQPDYLHMLLLKTTFGFAIAISAEGWAR